MTQNAIGNKRWNLFARELEDLLKNRGMDLNALTSKASIHPEYVRRLKHSLAFPKFHLLNPEDLESVIQTFKFSNEEQLRLRAAILATAIEEALMDRIDPDNAMQAAEEIFPVLVKALRQRLGQQQGLAATRRTVMEDETDLRETIEPALDYFDRAMVALYLGRYSNNTAERTEQISKARNGFAVTLAALEALRTADEALAQTETWQLWYQEAQRGLASAQQDYPGI